MSSVLSLLEEKWAGNRARDTARLASIPLPQGVTEYCGLPYRPGGDPMHTLNLYRPTGTDAPLPTIVNIHGGGWMYGDRTLNRPHCRFLSAEGFAVMGMSYRLLPQTDLAGQLRDVVDSLWWLSRHGADYGFDLSRVLLCGDSAGAHLAGLAACAALSRELQALYGVPPLPFPISALGFLHPVCDPFSFVPQVDAPPEAIRETCLTLMLGKDWRSSPRSGQLTFPQTAPGLPLPPIFLLESESDHYYAQSLALERFLRQQRLPHQSLCWTRAQGEHLTHVFPVSWWFWPESQSSCRAMLDFFRRTAP